MDRLIYQVRIGVNRISHAMTSLREPGAFSSAMDAGCWAMVSTAMRAVNAIPYVVQAKPGLLSALDYRSPCRGTCCADGGRHAFEIGPGEFRWHPTAQRMQW